MPALADMIAPLLPHDWFVTEVRMTFSRPVPLQIAGDAVGYRQSVDYRVHPRPVFVLDWRALV